MNGDLPSGQPTHGIHDARQAIREIVDDGYVIAVGGELHAGVTADEPRASRDKNRHKPGSSSANLP
jgi:hypothetical protein